MSVTVIICSGFMSANKYFVEIKMKIYNEYREHRPRGCEIESNIERCVLFAIFLKTTLKYK